MEDARNDLARAFPSGLAADVRDALKAMGPPFVTRAGHVLAPTSGFTVRVSEESVTIRYRIYNGPPEPRDYSNLSLRSRLILDCLYTRHSDGYERQRRLERVVPSEHPWVVPFVVQLVGEYVIDILNVIKASLRGLDDSDLRRVHYAEFVRGNPRFIDLTAQRVASYWNCYYRLKYPDAPPSVLMKRPQLVPGLKVYTKSDYPGFQLMGLLRSLN